MPPKLKHVPSFYASDNQSELSASPFPQEFDGDKFMVTSSTRAHVSFQGRVCRKRTPISYRESDTDDDNNNESFLNHGKKDGKNKARALSPYKIPLTGRKRKQSTPKLRSIKRKKLDLERWDDDSDVEDDVEKARLGPLAADHATGALVLPECALDKLPTEVIQRIAALLPTDIDLVNLTAVCRRFSNTIHPQNSSVWSSRFLANFDFPLIENTNQFCAAYKERSLVLKNFVDFRNGSDRRLDPQLVVLLDMVLETFNRRSYTMSKITTFHRSDYDIAKVYNWNATFGTMYLRLPDEKPRHSPYSLFPNLQVPKSAKLFFLDTNTLLHIRNFWHRHMILDIMPSSKTVGDLKEDTYYRVVERLMELGHVPRAWSESLLHPPSLPPKRRWVGFYSTINAWPDNSSSKLARQTLSDIQTDAQDWSNVDPLKLDLCFHSRNNEIVHLRHNGNGPVPYYSASSLSNNTPSTSAKAKSKGEETTIWPNTFARIPLFHHTVPSTAEARELEAQGYGKVWYLKGVAPFMDVEAEVQEQERKRRQPSYDTSKPGKGRRAGKRVPGASLRPASTSSGADEDEGDREDFEDDEAYAQSTHSDADDSPPASGTTKSKEEGPPPRHPFHSMRVRGVIHPLPWTHPSEEAQSDLRSDPFFASTSSQKTRLLPKLVPSLPVPGFQRIILVFYVPTLLQLIQQLEHSTGVYGNSFGVSISAQMDNTQIQSILNGTAGLNGLGGGAPGAGQAGGGLNPAELDDQVVDLLKQHLAGLMRAKEQEIREAHEANTRKNNPPSSKNPKHDNESDPNEKTDDVQSANASTTATKPPRLTRRQIWTSDLLTSLELNLHPDGQLTWDEIDYAYAYEGVICPGGNVMLGRWWRIGAEGLIDEMSIGAECDIQGLGVPDGLNQSGFKYWDDEDGGSGNDQGGAGPSSAAGSGVGGSASTTVAQGGANAESGGDGPATAASPEPTIHNKSLSRGPFVFWTMADGD